MKDYTVEWIIEVQAENAEDAARQALAIQRDRKSMATVFDVIEADGSGEAERVDLTAIDQER